MRVFLTGATGFIGSRIVPQLIGAGHQVLGLTRSEAGAEALIAGGAEPFRGTIEEPEGLRAGAAQADAVIHTAFDHDFSRFVANCEKDRRVIEAIGAELVGTDKPFLITSGVGMGDAGDGKPATENVYKAENPNPRVLSEATGETVRQTGVDVRIVRLPQVHDPVKQGLITPFIAISRQKGASAYVGAGTNVWSAAHVLDVAELYRLVLEKGRPGGRYHAVAEEGVPAKAIAEVIARGLGVPAVSLTPEQVPAHYGDLALFAAFDLPASSAQTRAELDWSPTGPGLIEDLEAMDYSAV